MADDPLSLTFAALADPTRRAILSRLADGDATVNELAEPFAMSVQAISKHLAVLERAGLISKGRNAQYRPCHLEPESLAPAIDWIERYADRPMDLADASLVVAALKTGCAKVWTLDRADFETYRLPGRKHFTLV